jgi:phosphomannomutase
MLEKIFKAYDIRGIYPDQLDETTAWKIGYGVGNFFKKGDQDGQGQVLVSRDMRKHSESVQQNLIAGIRAAGTNVVNLGMCDTSFQYFAINHLKALGGVQVTASHNQSNYNGFKISREQAIPVGGDTGLAEIREVAEQVTDTNQPAKGDYEEMDLWEAYRKHILQFLAPLKRPIKIFVDASNGMAGKLVPQVFEGIENLQIVSLNFETTGEFAHEPNPLKEENMKPTQVGVQQHECDLGACFDGDADRCMLTDEKGNILGCDHLTALLANHFVAVDRTELTTPSHHVAPDQTTIAYDLRSSKVVAEEIERLGATARRSRVGHVFMKAALRETEGIFGGELSGHFYYRDNYYADSGAITLASVLDILSANPDKTMSELIGPYQKYPQSGEINYEVEDKRGVMDQLKQQYQHVAAIDELDGVTVDAWDTKGWWFNVRASNTEPLLRMNAEGKDQASLDQIVEELKPMLGQPAEAH